jgi:Tol biopolymer transport system component
MDDIEDRLRSLASKLSGHVDHSGVEDQVQRRAARRRWIGVVRPPAIVLLVIVMTVGGWVLLSRVFRPGTDLGTVTGTGPSTSPPVVVPPSATSPGSLELTGTIAFESRDSSLFVLNLADGQATKIVDRASVAGLSWSPDGSMIAFPQATSEGSGRIVVTDVTGTTTTVVTQLNSSGAAPCCPQYPTWSPDGAALAFTAGSGEVFTVKADGSKLTQITGLSQQDCADQLLSWSPTGSFIASDRQCADHAASGIYMFGPSGSDPTMIFPVTGNLQGISVSPDGTKIAFAQSRKGVFVVSVDGTGLTQLTKGWDSSPAWSPGGSTIAFSRDYQVWAVSAEGGEATQVTALTSIRVIALAWARSA